METIRKGLIPLLLLLVACSTRYEVMGREQFSRIDVGTPVHVLTDTYGPPYAIHSKKRNQEVFEYIERFNVGGQTLQYKRYFFVIEDKIVIGKYVKVTNPPPYEKIYSDDAFPNY